MSKEQDPANNIPTDEDRLNYLKFLVDSGRYSEFPDQTPPASENSQLTGELSGENTLSALSMEVVSQYQKVPQTVITIAEIIPTKKEVQFPEEQQQMLVKMESFRLQVVSKLTNDLQKQRLIECSTIRYKRTIKTYGGELIIFYKDNSLNQNIRLFWEKKLKDGFGQIIRGEEKSVQINQGGYFQIRTKTITPSNPEWSTEEHIIKEGLLKTSQKTPEAIQKVESLVNLYLQADKSWFKITKSKFETIKRFFPPIFHK